ncbi:hypothetical protein NKW53_14935 [Acetobacter orientalis]|uniref:hypothetical protein n=1 Tax=Acetobacter orientalis TaxID=146474 RepID=UPI00209E4E1F|nr:hypothetical protein [Acetobacter orientalis]MCP1217328.1 hypothetical protein [Acetobacter orientalis]MCP1220217.1 hypothetical protein [Acetobacter orientalis]
MTEIIPEYGAALCCFRGQGNDGLSEFNCFGARGYGTICHMSGVGLCGAGKSGFRRIIPHILDVFVEIP